MKRKPKTEIDIDKRTITISNGSEEKKIPLNNKQIVEILNGKRFSLKAKNKKQKDFIKLIEEKEIVLATGPAGTGKSYVALGKAIELLMNPDNSYSKIFICRPAVESEEKLGALPGDIESKLLPYIYPSYYLIDKMIGKDNRNKLVELKILEPIALAYMKGMNIDSSILIFEEAQNSTIQQMKTLITRIGINSRFIISGDLDQTDRDSKENCGLYRAIQNLKDIKEIGIIEFADEDIVRNQLISKILEKY
jgi:phosphate starvation-inducible PhoH-like protein